MGRTLALAVCLAAAAMLAWFEVQTPSARPADAPAERFSAVRAMADVRAIAREPHPVGSAANAAVRQHLVQRLQELGLETQVQSARTWRAFGPDQTTVLGGQVENVVGVLPGLDRDAPALALMAHYDTVPSSPGAADDAAGVAAALEIVRALQARGRPQRDVVVLLTDGEEAGLLGAQAFFNQHPLADEIGFLINMEARGGGGRAQMFQTGPDNKGTIDLFQRTAVRPASSSAAVFLYELMPNDTDFSVAKEAGIPGLNYAFLGRQFDYHTASAAPRNLDQGALQDMGQQVLAVARATAFADTLPEPGPSQVYAQTFGSLVIAYPPLAGWGVLAVAAGLLGVAIWRARRAERLVWRDVAQGAGAGLYALTLSAALLRLAGRGAASGSDFLSRYALLAEITWFETALILVGLGAVLYAAAALASRRARWTAAGLGLGAGVAVQAFGWDPVGLSLGVIAAATAVVIYGRGAGRGGAWAGLLASGLIVAVVLQIVAPLTAFLVAWPVTLGALAAAVSGLELQNRRATAVVAAVVIVAVVAWVGQLAHSAFLALGQAEALAVFAWLAALVLWPLAQPAPENGGGPARGVALLVVLCGLGMIAALRTGEPWSVRHPQPSGVVYNLDLDADRAWRVAFVSDRAGWARSALAPEGGPIETRPLPPLFRRPLPSAPAPMVEAAPPQITLSARPGGHRILTVRPPPGARMIAVDLRSAEAHPEAALNGRPTRVLAQPGRWGRIRWHADPQGFELAFRPGEAGAIELRYAMVFDAWPQDAAPLPPRPPRVGPYDMSGSTVVSGSERLTW